MARSLPHAGIARADVATSCTVAMSRLPACRHARDLLARLGIGPDAEHTTIDGMICYVVSLADRTYADVLSTISAFPEWKCWIGEGRVQPDKGQGQTKKPGSHSEGRHH
jgi:hypothetical protein